MLSSSPPRLDRALFEGHTVDVAQALLGKLLIHQTEAGLMAGRVVETEAYHGPEDQACHAARGKTPRTTPMFGPAGQAYVYRIYGMWWCLNAVTGPVDFPAAVLIRALAPLDPGHYGRRDAAGPGKLCRLLGLDGGHNLADLVDGQRLWFADDGFVPAEISSGPRIGVDYAGDWVSTPWRFWVSDEPSVSKRPRRPKGV